MKVTGWAAVLGERPGAGAALRRERGAACRRRDAGHKNHFIWATMGTRGHAFVTGRSSGDRIIHGDDLSLERAARSSPSPPRAAATSPTAATHASAWRPRATGRLGDDHGNFTVEFLRNQAPCPPGIPGAGRPWAHVRSNDAPAGTDQHLWSGRPSDDYGHRLDHTMGTCYQLPRHVASAHGLQLRHRDRPREPLGAAEELRRARARLQHAHVRPEQGIRGT